MVQTRSSTNRTHLANAGSKTGQQALNTPTPKGPRNARKAGAKYSKQNKENKRASREAVQRSFTMLKQFLPARDRKCFPTTRRWLRTAEQVERWENFQSHPMVLRFDERFALCKRCFLNVKLCNKNCFDPTHWDMHCMRCLRRDLESASFKEDQQENWKKLSPGLQRWVKRRPNKEKVIPEDVLRELRREYLGHNERNAASKSTAATDTHVANSQSDMVVDTESQSRPLPEVTVNSSTHSADDHISLLTETNRQFTPPLPEVHPELNIYAHRAQSNTHTPHAPQPCPTHDELSVVQILLSFRSGHSGAP